MKKVSFIAVLALLINTLFAQTKTGSIRGSVQNIKQEPLAGLTVQLLNTTKSTQTNEDGEFEINNILEGTYTISVTGVGFVAKKQAVKVVPSKKTTLALQLSEDEKELTEVVVTGHTKGYAQDEISPTTRLNAPVLEVPQNIVSVSSSLLKDQQQTDISGVVGNVSGVTQGSPNPFLRPDFIIRGSSVDNNKLRNGVGGFRMNPYEDAAIIDHVEFIKGPAGFLMSNGEPGGMINIITKQARKERLFDASLMFGNFQFYRSAIDMGGSLSSDKKWYYRMNVAAQSQMTATDFYGFRRYTIAPVVSYDIDEKTTVTAELNIINGVSIGGVDPVVPGKNGGYWNLPNNFSQNDYSLPNGYNNSYFNRLHIQHKISDNWKITGQAVYYAMDRLDYNYYSRDGSGYTGVFNASGDSIINRALNYWQIYQRSVVGQFFVNGKFNTGNAFEHNLLLGYDAGHISGGEKYPDFTVLPNIALSVDNPNYGVSYSTYSKGLVIPETYDMARWLNYNWQALYALDHIKIANTLIVTLGGRYTSYNLPTSSGVETSKAFTPRAGLTYLASKNVSVYTLYDQSFLHQSGKSFTNERFKPLTGDNIEAGIKTQWFNGNLQANVAVFQIQKNNLLAADPNHANFSIQLDKQTSKGLEVDVIGQLTKGLNAVVNYAYTNSTTYSSDLKTDYPTYMVPKNNFNTWLKYNLQTGAAKGLGFAIGLNVVDDTRAATYATDKPVYCPGYQLVNAAISFQKDKFNLGINVTNVFNQRYMTYGYYATDVSQWYYGPSNPTDFRISLGLKL